MTAKAITVKASPTTTTISIRENPCSAFLVRLLIPELLRLLAVRYTGDKRSARIAPCIAAP
jgi:hypothetical protein